MSNVSRGNAAELKGARLLESEGWLVGSRRHIGGAGDLLAVKAGCIPRLVEVKSTKAGPWMHFRWKDRADMLETAMEMRVEAWLLWWPAQRDPKWLPAAEWPEGKAGLLEGLAA